jgi:hypothetical protein
VVVFEVTFGVLDEGRCDEPLVGQGERRVFGKDFSAVSAPEPDAPGIDDANQIAFPDAELSGPNIVSGKVGVFFLQPGHVSRWQTKKRSITDWL